MLRVDGLGVSYGDAWALREVSFNVSAGERWAVLGPNGAGKSTLAHVLVGAVRPTRGHVQLEGLSLDAYESQALARRVAWVPQVVAEDLEFSALEVVLLGRTPYVGAWGLTSSAEGESALQALEAVGLRGVAERPVSQLSGGERRRVYLARALVQAPALLVLDEPTAFLDVRHQLEALDVVRARVDASNAVVAMLHDVTLTARFATHVLLLRDGAVLAQGPVDSVLSGENLSALYGVTMQRGEAWLAR